MILTRMRRSAAVGLALGLVAVGCGGSDDDGDDGVSAGPADDDAAVIATTSIWADVTSNVACGAEVATLIPAGADPHSFEPSLRDRELLDRATVVVTNGLGLEESLTDMLATAEANPAVDVIELTDDLDILTPDDHDDHDHDADDHDDADHADDEDADDADHDHDDADHDDGDDDADPEDGDHADDSDDHEDGDNHDHDHDGGDPHVWQDPRRVADALGTIDAAVASAGLDTCTDDYRDELLALDAEIETLLAPVAADERVLVTNHDSLAYFADRYGFEVLGTVIPSTSTLAETNAADLADLADEIADRDVPAIFTEELESSADADALASRLGVEIVPLVTDALGDDPDTDTYLEMMRSNANAVATALGS